MNSKQRCRENGSVLVFILIGVALFAALSYAMTQSLRMRADSSGSTLGTAERDTTTITDVMQFLDALKMRVFELTSVNNIAESRLDFKNDVYLLPNGAVITVNNNAACGAASSCSVFSPYGPSGITAMTFPNAADPTAQSSPSIPRNGHGRIAEAGINGVGTTAPDLVFIIHGIKPTICNLYNSKQGITTNYDNATTLTSIGESPASSIPDTFNGFVTTNTFGYGATIFAGKKSFCAPAVDDAIGHRLAIWHILKAR